MGVVAGGEARASTNGKSMSREAASPPATSSSVGTSAGVARKREKEKAYSQRHTRRCRALDCIRLKDGRRGVGRGDLVHRSVTYTLASPSVHGLPHELACTSPAWPSIAPSPIALVFILPGSVGRGSCRLALVLLARVLVLISLRLADSHEPPS